MDPLPPPKTKHRASSGTLSSINEGPEESSSSHSDSTPTRRGRTPPSVFKHPYDDDFGLERPPPPYNLEGEWNYNKVTGVRIVFSLSVGTDNQSQRRILAGRSKKFYPVHHEPTIYIEKQPYSNSAVQVIRKINEMSRKAVEDSWEDLPSVEQQLRRLRDVKQFVHESAALDEWDSSGRQRSVEARMEELLKTYGYDKVERKVGNGKEVVRD